MVNLQELYDAILNGDQKKAIAVAKQALVEKTDAQTVVTK